jgi:hypothetical protein
MSDRLSELEGRVAALGDALGRLETRLAVLERRPAKAAGPRRAAIAPAADVTAAQVAGDFAAVSKHLALAGRTLLVLAGAFLLRAVTDSGAIPTWLGVALGCAYAGAWVALAHRDGPAKPWSAAFHGVSAIVIGFPLLFEATTRFHLLSPEVATVVLTGFTGVALAMAALRRLQAIAWLVEIGGIVTALALMVATAHLASPVLYLGAVGVATLWLGYVLDWIYLRWPIAFVTDLAVVFITMRAVSPTSAEGPRMVLVVQVAVMALYLGSIALRTLLLNRSVVDFEVVQTAVLLGVGVGGASYVTTSSGMGAAAVGVITALFGAATYAVAFAFVERRRAGKANFYFYGAVALVFVLAGTALVLPDAALSVTWAVLAVITAALSRTLRRATLAVHACIYGVAASIQSHALDHAGTALVASPAIAWPRVSAVVPLVVAGLLAATWLTGRTGAAPVPPQNRIPRCLLVASVALAAAGLLVGWLVPPLAGAPGPGASAGVTATIRTAVLVAGVLLLAWLGRREAWREAGWLAYPLLVVTGFKLVLEDIARSRPASLFLAFALYGAALILVPRLRRRDTPARPAATAPPAAA